MARGRRSLPTNWKLLHGNPSKRPINKDEPKPKLKVPRCPPGLPREAQLEWRRVVRDMAQAKMLTGLDKALLVTYCLAWATVMEATAELEKRKGRKRESVKMLTAPSGYKYQNPWYGVRNTAIKQMVSVAAELGFSPSSRSRILQRASTGLTTPPNPDDDTDSIFTGSV